MNETSPYMANATAVFEIANIVISLFMVLVVTALVFRTEKEFDKSFKLMLFSGITLFLASLLRIDKYLGIIPDGLAELVMVSSRTVSVAFMVAALCVLLHAISKERR